MSKPYLANRMDGSQINFADPHYGPFDPQATFRQLSFINRWAGNLLFDYSVLQHSLHVAELIPQPELKIYGLIHDVPEDGTGDVTGPFKGFVNEMLGGFVNTHEAHMLTMLCMSMGVAAPTRHLNTVLHRADMTARATELRDVVANKKGITIQYEPDTKILKPAKREQLIMQAVDAFHTYLDLHIEHFEQVNHA